MELLAQERAAHASAGLQLSNVVKVGHVHFVRCKISVNTTLKEDGKSSTSVQTNAESGKLQLVCEDDNKEVVEAVLAIQGVIAKQGLPPFANLARYVNVVGSFPDDMEGTY